MSGYEVFERWEREGSTLKAEFVGGNISGTFTGRVSYHSCVELRLARDEDELSISLFFGEVQFFNEVKGSTAAAAHFQDNYVCAARITTDGGASCVVFELRNRE